MPGRSVRIARIAGIPVGISPLWLIVVALITWSLGAGYYPSEVHGITTVGSNALGLVSALLLFASILAHEFGHALVARRRGVQVEEIDLWLLGGVARMSGQPRTAEDEREPDRRPRVTLTVERCSPTSLSALIRRSRRSLIWRMRWRPPTRAITFLSPASRRSRRVASRATGCNAAPI